MSEARAPWTLVFASGQNHAFDFFSDTDEARRIIRQTILFWKSHLEPVPGGGSKPLAVREIMGEAYYGNNPQRTVELLEKWIAENPPDRLAYTTLGRAFRQLRKPDEAATALKKALQLGEPDSGLYFNLGELSVQLKRYDEAFSNFAKSIEVGGPNGVIFLQMGLVQMAMGRNTEAVVTFEKALDGGIAKWPVYFNIARARARLQQYDLAFDALTKSVVEGFANRRDLESEPSFETMRSDPRFQQLLERLK